MARVDHQLIRLAVVQVIIIMHHGGLRTVTQTKEWQMVAIMVLGISIKFPHGIASMRLSVGLYKCYINSV